MVSAAYQHARAVFVHRRLLQESISCRLVAQYAMYSEWVAHLAAGRAAALPPPTCITAGEADTLASIVRLLHDEFDALAIECATAYDDDERAAIDAVAGCSYAESLSLLYAVA
jgi:hypothetical protein